MTARLLSTILLASLIISSAYAKDKSKSKLPEQVLRARTVLVVVNPDAGEPVDNPTANSTARENVEKALMEWGRLQPVMDGQEADLVIAVKTGDGRMGRPTIKGGPTDSRTGVMQPTDGGIRIGGQHGHAPPLNDPSMNPPQNDSPRVTNEVGTSQDTFEVYLGSVQYPLDVPPIWRYSAKDCLRASPAVPAVEQFRKAMTEAEKAQQQKKNP